VLILVPIVCELTWRKPKDKPVEVVVEEIAEPESDWKPEVTEKEPVD